MVIGNILKICLKIFDVTKMINDRKMINGIPVYRFFLTSIIFQIFEM